MDKRTSRYNIEEARGLFLTSYRICAHVFGGGILSSAWQYFSALTNANNDSTIEIRCISFFIYIPS